MLSLMIGNDDEDKGDKEKKVMMVLMRSANKWKGEC